MNTEKITALISRFLIDSDVANAMKWSEDRNLFDIAKFKESGNSNMIGWLLNPRQGHGMGDYFFKSLLKAALTEATDAPGECKEGYKRIKFLGQWDVLDLERYSFGDVFVDTEINIEDGRLDIVAVDFDNKFVIMIENKFGSKQHDNQLSTYFEWKFPQLKNFHYVYIYLDYDGKRDDIKAPWIQLNYSWLIEALKSVIDRSCLPDHINVILKDYYIYLADAYEKETYYKGIWESFPKITHRHYELLGILKKYELKSGLNLREISLHKYLNQSKQRSCELVSFEERLIHLYLRHKDLYESLFDFSSLEYVKDEILNRSSVYSDFEVEDKKLFLRNPEWGYYQEENADFWPIYIKLELKRDESLADPEYEVSICVNLKNSNDAGNCLIYKLCENLQYKISQNQYFIVLAKDQVAKSAPSSLCLAVLNKLLKADDLIKTCCEEVKSAGVSQQ